jgi:ribonuclease T1
VSLLSWLARSSAATLVAGSLLVGWTDIAQAKESSAAITAEVELSALPVQAQETYRLIHTGGPFPYSKDGVAFGNRERQLPRQPRGYYREYTVKTPGARNRGARRLICGGQPPTAPAVCFYTDDHYASFKRIRAAAGK